MWNRKMQENVNSFSSGDTLRSSHVFIPMNRILQVVARSCAAWPACSSRATCVVALGFKRKNLAAQRKGYKPPPPKPAAPNIWEGMV